MTTVCPLIWEGASLALSRIKRPVLLIKGFPYILANSHFIIL